MKGLDKDGLEKFIIRALDEDIKDGDHTTLACIPVSVLGSAKLLVKANGIICGVDIAKTPEKRHQELGHSKSMPLRLVVELIIEWDCMI